MDNVPLCFPEGLAAIVQEARDTDRRIQLVAVNSSSNGYLNTLVGNDSVQSKHETLVRAASGLPAAKGYLIVDESELLYYTAPEEVSHSGHKRTETVPVIQDPKGIYLVIDDTFHSGKTAFHAAKRLCEQGVNLDDIWLMMCIDNYDFKRVYKNIYPKGESSSLDRATRFFEYIGYKRISELVQEPANREIIVGIAPR